MKKVYETALHVAAFRSIISPPTRTHIMKTIYGTKITRIILTTLQLAIAKAKSSKSTFQTSSANAMTDLNEKILQWADDKGILANGTPKGQLSKTLEELIETAQAVALFDFEQDKSVALEAVKDGIGDVYVTLVIHAKMNGFVNVGIASIDELTNKQAFNQLGKCIIGLATFQHWDTYALANGILEQIAANHGLTLRECVEHSYNVIAKRTGEMIDGVFVKDN